MDKSDHVMEVGDRIFNLRMDKGYSREQLGEMAGISAKFIYQIEVKHAGFSIDTLHGLSKALDVSSDYILTGKSSYDMCDARIAETLDKFGQGNLDKLERLIKIVYDLFNEK